jgi:DNA-binding transcriptional LysR family regulator
MIEINGMDRFTSLETFVRVVDESGFAAAARSLNMSAGMVSKHVNGMERRLGTRLLNRTTRRLALTDAGRQFYEQARLVLRGLDEAERAVTARSSQPEGLLRVAAPFVFSERYIAPYLPSLLRRYPNMEIEIACDDNVVDLVQGHFDLAIRIGKLPDSCLVARKLALVEVSVCGAPSYLGERGTPQTLDDLSGHVCLEYDYQWSGAGWGFRGSNGNGDVIARLGQTPYRSNNAQILRAMALDGLGLVQLPTFMVGPDLVAGRLTAVLTKYRPVERWVHAVYPPGRQLPATVRMFSDFFAELFRTPPWSTT